MKKIPMSKSLFGKQTKKPVENLNAEDIVDNDENDPRKEKFKNAVSILDSMLLSGQDCVNHKSETIQEIVNKEKKKTQVDFNFETTKKGLKQKTKSVIASMFQKNRRSSQNEESNPIGI